MKQRRKRERAKTGVGGVEERGRERGGGDGWDLLRMLANKSGFEAHKPGKVDVSYHSEVIGGDGSKKERSHRYWGNPKEARREKKICMRRPA